ncbi:unnamed protein product [Amoebophrya sp. A120]|nr:unnamed protein product [Amoebophrya sp. A120]|eukprot:GSA120T00016543001.1
MKRSLALHNGGNARPGSGQLGSDPYRATTLESAPVISPEEKAKLEQEIATREATIDRLQKELDKVKAKMPDLPPLLKRSGRFYVDELTHQGKFNSLPREDKTFFIGEVNWQKEEHSRPLEEKKKAKEREFKKHQREEEFEIQNLKKQLEGKGPVDESVRELHDLSVAQDDARDEKSEVDARWMPPINEFAKEADFAKWCCEEAGLLKLSGEPCESKGGRAGDGLNKNWLAASDDEKEQMRRDYNEKFLPKQEAERTKQKAKAAQKVADADRNLLRATGN